MWFSAKWWTTPLLRPQKPQPDPRVRAHDTTILAKSLNGCQRAGSPWTSSDPGMTDRTSKTSHRPVRISSVARLICFSCIASRDVQGQCTSPAASPAFPADSIPHTYPPPAPRIPNPIRSYLQVTCRLHHARSSEEERACRCNMLCTRASKRVDADMCGWQDRAPWLPGSSRSH